MNIPNEDLHPDNLPRRGADFNEIYQFAFTFNGYEYWKSFDKCAEVANRCLENYRKTGKLPDTLVELRTCLFFENRRWHHFGDPPDEEVKSYFTEILERIRNIIEALSD